MDKAARTQQICSSAVDEFVDSGIVTRVLVQTEISYANSPIEPWRRVLSTRLASSIQQQHGVFLIDFPTFFRAKEIDF
jgi:hypothetical protein